MPQKLTHERERPIGADTQMQQGCAPMRPVVRRGRIAWMSQPPAGSAFASVASRTFTEMPVSLPNGDPAPEHPTPGELLATAYATIIAEALAEELTVSQSPAQEIVVEVACIFAAALPARKLIALDLDVSGRVRGLDTDGFRRAADTARRRAMQSAGARENLPSCLHATLEPSA